MQVDYQDKLNFSHKNAENTVENNLNNVENAIVAINYEQNQKKIRQELYQVISEKQENIIETKRKKKRNKILRKFFNRLKESTKELKNIFRNIIKSKEKCEN